MHVCMITYVHLCTIQHMFNHASSFWNLKTIFKHSQSHACLRNIPGEQNTRFMELLDVTVANLTVVPEVLMFGGFDLAKHG